MPNASEDPGSLPEPWWIPPDKTLRGLERQLKTEVGSDHILHGCDVTAVAKRQDCDEVLFRVVGRSFRWAVVHLTWRDRTEPAPWPMATTYASVSELLEDQADELWGLEDDRPEPPPLTSEPDVKRPGA